MGDAIFVQQIQSQYNNTEQKFVDVCGMENSLIYALPMDPFALVKFLCTLPIFSHKLYSTRQVYLPIFSKLFNPQERYYL